MNTAVWSHSAMNTAANHAQLVLGVTVSIMTNTMPPIKMSKIRPNLEGGKST